MKFPIYDGFEDWADVARQYTDHNWDDSEEVRTTKALAVIPQPEEVLVAVYEQGGYEGSSWVVFRNGEEWFLEQSGHCSCYGLEGSWCPEKYETIEFFLQVLKRRDSDYNYGAEGNYLKITIEELERRIKND